MKAACFNLVLLSLFTCSASAALAPEQGLSGNITVLSGVTSNSSNLNVKQDNQQTTADLASKGSDEASITAGLLGSLQYTFGDSLDKQLFMGTSREDIVTGSLAFELGYRQQLAGGTIVDIAVLPTLISGEVWDDPYAVEQSRNKTDLSGNVYRLQLTSIVGSNFDIDMAAGESDVDEERTGTKGLDLTQQQRDLLTRERKYYYFKTAYRHVIPQQQAMLIPSLNVFASDSEGDALSFMSYGGEVSYARRINQHGFVLTASAAWRDYDAENPIFAQTRQDKDFGLFLAYEYANIWGYKDWSLVSFVGAQSTRSNIDYYQSEQYIMSVGLDYKF
ncbi:DUF2860 domain-containing protein [Vibrio ponticus]|uniref:DUF2860 domain-containing protein n=1 Tax=Vibrio ponticus TaxID=265668 RepID=A0A3N3DT90_9VIBR|nr:DUF2860 family protein [Vibrio ponticus]ROV57727.1 DUF2860 domain-containing protein [Vibrio ponticus]